LLFYVIHINELKDSP